MDQLEETARGRDETLQEVIRQLKAQQLQDTARINKVSQAAQSPLHIIEGSFEVF